MSTASVLHSSRHAMGEGVPSSRSGIVFSHSRRSTAVVRSWRVPRRLAAGRLARTARPTGLDAKSELAECSVRPPLQIQPHWAPSSWRRTSCQETQNTVHTHIRGEAPLGYQPSMVGAALCLWTAQLCPCSQNRTFVPVLYKGRLGGRYRSAPGRVRASRDDWPSWAPSAHTSVARRAGGAVQGKPNNKKACHDSKRAQNKQEEQATPE